MEMIQADQTGAVQKEEHSYSREKQILVVDDEKSIRELMREILSAAGYRVATASNGREGLQLFTEGYFDLVISDLNMPDLDGSHLAREIKIQSPETPVMIVTGESALHTEELTRDQEVDAVMFKPFNIIEFRDAARRLTSPDPFWPSSDRAAV